MHDQILETCFTCGIQFQMGPHRYDGKCISRYNISVCRTCYDGNWDGWAPRYEEKILEHLASAGISEPERNAKGYLPRD